MFLVLCWEQKVCAFSNCFLIYKYILFCREYFHCLLLICVCLFILNEVKNIMLLCCLILNGHRWIYAWTIWKLWIKRGLRQALSCISQRRAHRGTKWKSLPAFLLWGPSSFQFNPFPASVNGNFFQSLLSPHFCCCPIPYSIFTTLQPRWSFKNKSINHLSKSLQELLIHFSLSHSHPFNVCFENRPPLPFSLPWKKISEKDKSIM